MPEVAVDEGMARIAYTLGEILAILKRIEDRQVKTTAMVAQIDEIEQKEIKQVQGSFGSMNQ